MASEKFNVPKEILEQLVLDLHGVSRTFHSAIYDKCTKTGDYFASDVSGLEMETRLAEDENIFTKNRFVVKKNPGVKKTVVLNKVMSLQFKKEGAFYTKILPILNAQLQCAEENPLRTPKFFHLDLAEGREILFLENMNDEGYYTLDRKKSLEIDTIKVVLAELARLHAASVMALVNHTMDAEALEEIYSQFINSREAGMFANSYEHYAELANDYDQQSIAQFFKTNKKHSQRIFEELLRTTDKFKVINHGEPWISNFLIKTDDEKINTCVLIDFQMIRLGSPALDLNHLFYTCLDGEARKANIDDYLEYYYDSFENVLKSAKFEVPFTKDELVKEYRRKNLFGYIMMIDTLYKVKCEDVNCLKVTDFISEDMSAIETKRRLYVKTRKDLMSSRLAALFSEMSDNESFQTEDIDEFIKNLNEE